MASSGRSTDKQDYPSTRSRNVGVLWGRRGWFACASSRKLDAVMGNATEGRGEEIGATHTLRFAFRDDRTTEG